MTVCSERSRKVFRPCDTSLRQPHSRFLFVGSQPSNRENQNGTVRFVDAVCHLERFNQKNSDRSNKRFPAQNGIFSKRWINFVCRDGDCLPIGGCQPERDQLIDCRWVPDDRVFHPASNSRNLCMTWAVVSPPFSCERRSNSAISSTEIRAFARSYRRCSRTFSGIKTPRTLPSLS